MSKRFGRNQKRELIARIKVLEARETQNVGNVIYGNRMLLGIKWAQGHFVDSPQYRNWSDSEKASANESESYKVRPYEHPTGNALCHCVNPIEAQWLAARLNTVDNLISENNKLRDEVNAM